jgi:hypothetical protein
MLSSCQPAGRALEQSDDARNGIIYAPPVEAYADDFAPEYYQPQAGISNVPSYLPPSNYPPQNIPSNILVLRPYELSQYSAVILQSDTQTIKVELTKWSEGIMFSEVEVDEYDTGTKRVEEKLPGGGSRVTVIFPFGVRLIYIFDKDDRLIEQERLDKDGKIEKEKFEYDEDGNKVRWIIEKPGHKMKVKYNKEGRIIEDVVEEEIEKSSLDLPTLIGIGVITGPGLGTVIGIINFLTKHKFTKKTLRTYDDGEVKTEDTVVTDSKGNIVFKSSIKYDWSSGKPREKEVIIEKYKDGKLDSKTVITFNADGSGKYVQYDAQGKVTDAGKIPAK